MLNFTLRCHVSEKNPSFIYNKARNMPSSNINTKQHEEKVITMAMFALLGTLAVGCQKENIIPETIK